MAFWVRVPPGAAVDCWAEEAAAAGFVEVVADAVGCPVGPELCGGVVSGVAAVRETRRSPSDSKPGARPAEAL